CAGCHVDATGNVPLHPVPIGTTACATCHNPHSLASSLASQLGSLHYNNMTGAGYPASYVSSRATCTDCHYVSATNPIIRQQWYTSAHAKLTDTPWASYDFKTKTGCVQCHTTTGFVAYSTGKMTAAWGSSADKTKEVLTCRGCHSSIASGALRRQTPVRPFGGSYVNPEVGKSNLCVTCHSGT